MPNDKEAPSQALIQAMPVSDSEHLLIAVLTDLGGEASGATIRQALEQRLGRSVALGTLYLLLDRLAAKGYVRATWPPGPSARSGQAIRHFVLISPAA